MNKIILFLILVFVLGFTSFNVKAIDYATQQQMVQVLSQIQTENSGSFTVWCHDFASTISFGDSNPEIVNLQMALYKTGVLEVGFISGIYDTATYSAVIKFQEKYRSETLTPAKLRYGTGKVGALTKAKLNKLFSCKLIANCMPSWTCTDWNKCSGNKQTRKCSDVSSCKTTFGKPVESKDCTLPDVKIYGNNTKGTITVNSGDSVNISWEAKNAIFCSATGNWTGGRNIKGLESTGPLNSPKIYNITCRDSLGKIAKDTLTVNVVNSIVNIKANGSDGPLKVDSGKSVALTWTAAGVKSCFASGDWSGDRDPTGSESTGYLTIPKQYGYGLTCSTNSGNISDVVYVSVAAPTVVIKANGVHGTTSVALGKPVTLTWTTTGVTTCNAMGAWSGVKTTSGSQQIQNVYQAGSYILNCTDSLGNSIGDSATVNIK